MAFRTLLQLTFLVITFANSGHSSVTSAPCNTTDVNDTSSQPILGNSNRLFDDSRITHNPDKVLLSCIKTYFEAFVNGDYDRLRDAEAPEYNTTDIPLTVVRLPRDLSYDANKAFAAFTTDTEVIAISLYGSCSPDSFAIMENVIWFTLTADPPPGPLSGYKEGDRVGMIMLSALWWNTEGKVRYELEYGRLTWEGFNITAFYQ